MTATTRAGAALNAAPSTHTLRDRTYRESALHEDAPAKINLFLHVTGRRADGYHLLDSLVVFAGVGDRLEARPAETLTLKLKGPFATALDGADNLVLKAAHALKQAKGALGGAEIALTKELPVASGIGGGSADAAAALRLLSRLWGTEDGELLARLALRLGADVPVCLASVPSRMSGIGEQIQPIEELAPLFLVLVNPGTPLATKAVFGRFGGPFSEAAPPLPTGADAVALAAYLARTRNDLEAPARALLPAIGAVLEALRQQEGCLLSRLSGSGATCFGVFAEERAAVAAATRLRATHADWWVRATSLLTA